MATTQFIIRYRADGQIDWVRQLGSASDDAAVAVATDVHGNMYVAGTTQAQIVEAPEDTGRMFIAKYDPKGDRKWVHQIGSGASDTPTGIGSDAVGNSYLVGTTTGTLPGSQDSNAGRRDAFIVEYNAAGHWQWTRQLGSTDDDGASGVTVDAAGNATVGGTTDGQNLPGSTDPNRGSSSIGAGFLASYAPSSSARWVRLLPPSVWPPTNDPIHAIAADASGSVYVAGSTTESIEGAPEEHIGGALVRNAFVAKYSDNGAFHWIHLLAYGGDHSGAPQVEATGIAATPDGVVIAGQAIGCTVTGAPESIGNASEQLFVASYDTSGKKNWAHQFGGDADPTFGGVAADPNGDLYVAGTVLFSRMPGAPEHNKGFHDIWLSRY